MIVSTIKDKLEPGVFGLDLDGELFYVIQTYLTPPPSARSGSGIGSCGKCAKIIFVSRILLKDAGLESNDIAESVLGISYIPTNDDFSVLDGYSVVVPSTEFVSRVKSVFICMKFLIDEITALINRP